METTLQMFGKFKQNTINTYKIYACACSIPLIVSAAAGMYESANYLDGKSDISGWLSLTFFVLSAASAGLTNFALKLKQQSINKLESLERKIEFLEAGITDK